MFGGRSSNSIPVSDKLKNPRKAGSVICLCEHGAHCACTHASAIPKLNNGARNTLLNQNISSRNSRNAYRYESSRVRMLLFINEEKGNLISEIEISNSANAQIERSNQAQFFSAHHTEC
jgi:hypothetical protein